MPFLSSGYVPDPGIEPTSPVSPTLQEDSLPTEPLGKVVVESIYSALHLLVLIFEFLFAIKYYGQFQVHDMLL